MMRAQLLAAVPCGPRLADMYIGPISSACHEFLINTPARMAAFVAQCAHESSCFVYTRELADGHAYEGRLDLGNTEPGDGVKFKGRGLIQITGRANYAACSLALFNDLRLLSKPSLLEQPTEAARSAAWFWKQHGLNELADVGDFRRITKIINGGYTHLDRRIALYQRALPAFGAASSQGVA